MIEGASPISLETLNIVRNNLANQLLAAVEQIVIKTVDEELIRS